MRALVIFHDDGLGRLSRCLKPGFRHCALAIDDGEYWVGFDGRMGLPDLMVMARSDEDLAADYRRALCTVVEVEIARRPLGRGLALNTCVGAIKRILGIRAPWVLTPHQLYRHLKET